MQGMKQQVFFFDTFAKKFYRDNECIGEISVDVEPNTRASVQMEITMDSNRILVAKASASGGAQQVVKIYPATVCCSHSTA